MLFTKHLNLHSLLEEWEWLGKIADTHLVLRIKLGVFHLKVEPLLVALCVCVDLAEKVVFLNYLLFVLLLNFYVLQTYLLSFDTLQISTLNSWIELQVLLIQCLDIPLMLMQELPQFFRLQLWRIQAGKQAELLVCSLWDKPVLVHMPHVSDNHVEHVLTHHVSVFGSVRLIDCLVGD